MSFFGWGAETPPKKETPPRGRAGAGSPLKKTSNGIGLTTQGPPVEVTRTDEEILASLEPVFFENPATSGFDALSNILNTIQDDTSAEDLQRMIAEREAQLKVVNSQLYEQVISHYDRFVQGMVHIRELGYDLETTVLQCREGRALLRKADQELISTPAQIIYNNRKRLLLQVSLLSVSRDES